MATDWTKTTINKTLYEGRFDIVADAIMDATEYVMDATDINLDGTELAPGFAPSTNWTNS